MQGARESCLNRFRESVVWVRESQNIAWVTFVVTAMFGTRISALKQ